MFSLKVTLSDSAPAQATQLTPAPLGAKEPARSKGKGKGKPKASAESALEEDP